MKQHAMCTGFSIHEDAAEAKRRGGDGFRYFGYSLGHYYVYGNHSPAQTNIWNRFERARDALAEVGKGSGIGTPTQVAEHLNEFAESGVDQVIFIQQGGKNTHEHICEAMHLFAQTVMPQFKANEAEREAKKAAELAPYIEAAMARKQRMAGSVPRSSSIALCDSLVGKPNIPIGTVCDSPSGFGEC